MTKQRQQIIIELFEFRLDRDARHRERLKQFVVQITEIDRR